MGKPSLAFYSIVRDGPFQDSESPDRDDGWWDPANSPAPLGVLKVFDGIQHSVEARQTSHSPNLGHCLLAVLILAVNEQQENHWDH